VVLKPGLRPATSSPRSCASTFRRRLAAHAYPRNIAFVEQLPETPSGNIQRFLLRNAEKAAANGAAKSH
jgi:acetyl-CoA synthetase